MANADGGKAHKWETLKGMPTKRVFSTPVEAKGSLYVVGGCDQMGTPIDAFEVYDPEKRKWFRLAQMPTKRAGTCAVSVGDKIVAMGGVAVDQSPLDTVEVYNIPAKKWETKESLKENLNGLSAVVRDGKIYAVGGMGLDTNPRDTLMCYDIETNLWSSLPKMPTPRYATFSFLIHDKLYVLGGRQGKIPTAAFEVFNFTENKWRKLPDIPSKRVFALYTCSDTHIFSLGGLNQDVNQGFSNCMEVFDLKTETWKIGKPMQTKRGDFAVGYMSSKVIAAGGLGNAGKPLQEAEAYDPVKDEWTAISNIPTAHCSCAYITFQGRLHIIGGLSIGGPSAAMESLVLR